MTPDNLVASGLHIVGVMRRIVLALVVLGVACSGSGGEGEEVAAGNAQAATTVASSFLDMGGQRVPLPEPGSGDALRDRTFELAAALVAAWHDGDRERANRLVTHPGVLDDLFSRAPGARFEGSISALCTASDGGGQSCGYAASNGLSIYVDVVIVDGEVRARAVGSSGDGPPPFPLPPVTSRP